MAYERTAEHREQIRARKTKHGANRRGARSPEYVTWAAMQSRCYNPKQPHFARYGARGVRVADEWRADGGFERFLAHIGPKPSPQHSIDRYPNTAGNYEPGNVRWATVGEQTRNRRSNILVTWQGETMVLTDWAERLGIKCTTLRQRIRRWPLERAMTEAINPTRPT